MNKVFTEGIVEIHFGSPDIDGISVVFFNKKSIDNSGSELFFKNRAVDSAIKITPQGYGNNVGHPHSMFYHL